MSAIPYEGQEEEGWDGYEDDESLALPGRRRRQFWGRGSAALLALVLGAIGFYVGVRVEKSQLSSSSSTTGGLAALAAARGGATGTRAAASRAGGAASFFSRAGGSGALAGGGGTFGTVSSVDGKNIYITETSTGAVVKVKLSSATAVTKSVGVSKSAIRPGDSVTVEGVKGSGGAIAATSVSDSGSRSGSSSSSSSSSSGSAVSSLFGSGGG